MLTVEVRYQRKIVLPFLAGFVLLAIGGLCYIFFSGILYTKNMYWAIASIVLTMPLFYMAFTRGRLALKNEPVLKFSDLGLEVLKNSGLKFISWSDITDFYVSDDKGGQHLTITTISGRIKVDIALLDKSPVEIRQLMAGYKN